MCPLCLASVAMVLSGGALTALLALKSRPLTRGENDDDASCEDGLEG